MDSSSSWDTSGGQGRSKDAGTGMRALGGHACNLPFSTAQPGPQQPGGSCLGAANV